MKTTIEISGDIAKRAMAYAEKEGATLRSLVERGLREVLRADRERHRFERRDARVGGRGLQAEFRTADWQRIREAAYKGRG